MLRMVITGALGLALAGCNTTSAVVPANGSAVVSQLGMFQMHACTAWEPPAGVVTQRPQHGQANIALVQGSIRTPGHPCQGKPISATIVRYTPRPGFTGSDQLTVDYTYIETDGGRRGSRSETVNIQVR